jgi:hypothetical protein
MFEWSHCVSDVSRDRVLGCASRAARRCEEPADRHDEEYP